MKKIISFTALLLFCQSLYAQPQFSTVNPSTFPFGITDAHIFDDGSAYIVSDEDPFLVKEKNIEQPDTSGNQTIISLGTNNFHNINCLDKSTCVGLRYKPTSFTTELYISNDSAQTWNLYSLNDIYDIRFITSTFWIGQTNNGLKITSDGGNSWQDLGYTDLRYSCSDGSIAYYVSTSNAKVYTVTTTGISVFAEPKLLIPNINIARAFFPTSSGYVFVADSGEVYSIDSTFSSYNQLYDLQEQWGNYLRDGDTILGIYSSQVLYSVDNGISWQLRNTSQNTPPFIYNYFALGHYNGKLYYAGPGHGVVNSYDYINDQRAVSAGNLHPTTSYLEEMGNGKYFAPSQTTRPDTTLVGYLIGEEGQMLRNDLNVPTSYLARMDFADSLNGVASSYNGYIYLTSDGGQNWTEVDMAAKLDTNQVQLVTVDYSDDASCINTKLRLNNSNVWRRVKLNSSLNIIENQVTSINDHPDYISCDTGLIRSHNKLHYTTDGGTSKSTILYAGAGSQIWYYKRTGRSLRVLTNQGGIYHTSDISLPLQHTPGNIYPLHDLFLLTDKFEILSYEGKGHLLFYSSDTGKTYSNVQFPVGTLNAFYQTDSNTILMAGEGGQIHLLKQYDQIGVGTDEPIADNAIAFYPNPARNSMKLEFPDNRQREIRIFNLKGEEVMSSSSHDSDKRIDISNLPAGLYICKVSDGNSAESFRFLKM